MRSVSVMKALGWFVGSAAAETLAAAAAAAVILVFVFILLRCRKMTETRDQSKRRGNLLLMTHSRTAGEEEEQKG
jgi:hypothetical protein